MTTITDQTRQLAVLSGLCVRQQAMLAEIPDDPKKPARIIFYRFNGAGRDE